MSTLRPWNPREVLTIWPRSPAPLHEVIAAAWRADASRVMLTGRRPPAGWFLSDPGIGWTHGAHHLDADTPVGRYNGLNGHKVEIRRAAEWFGPGDYTPAQAAKAWAALTEALAEAVPGMDRLLGSPGATGREAYLHSRSWLDGQPVDPPQVSTEVAELLHATSGQHRIELMPEPEPGGVRMCGKKPTKADAAMVRQFAAKFRGENELWLLDGRLMYAACVLGLGTGPARWLTADQAANYFTADPYARARYLVQVTVPEWWETAGILPHKAGDDSHDGWEYPCEPGRTFQTWADASEVWLAKIQFGWSVTFLTGLAFTPGRPLDTWATRLLRAFDRQRVGVIDLQGTTEQLVRAGIRFMLLHSIGAWHSTGRTETTITAGPMDRPPGHGWGAPTLENKAAVWRRRVPLDGRAALMAHPEWSAQVWGRARARVLWAPTAVKGVHAGALTIPATELVSIYGDALMTTVRPEWAAPRFDDGRPGRLRVKGYLPDLAAAGGWPTTSAARDRLMHQAETNGPPREET
jgi:hypothetical protein